MRPYFDASERPSFRALAAGDDARPYHPYTALHMNCAFTPFEDAKGASDVASESKDVGVSQARKADEEVEESRNDTVTRPEEGRAA